MSAQVQQASILSGRQLVLAVTIALHAAAISGLMAWRIAEVMQTQPGVIQITDPIPNPDPPPVPRPDTPDRQVLKTIYVPPLDDRTVIRIDDEAETVSTHTEEVAAVRAGGAGSAIVEQVAPPADTALQYRATRASDDYYPAQAIRLGQEGVSIVRVCVDATGAHSTLPQVVKSSRSRLLDGAAVTWAREALQFTPATHAGAAVGACKEFRVNFTLH